MPDARIAIDPRNPLPFRAVDLGDGTFALAVSGTGLGGGGGLDAEGVRDAIFAALVAGANVTITQDDPANTITVAATGGGGLTTEDVDDRVGTLVVPGGGLTADYNDAANTLTLTAAGFSEVSIVESVPRHVVTTPGALTANAAYYAKVRFQRTRTLTTVYWYIGATPSGNVDLGLYDSADGGVTLTRLGSTGAVSTGAANAVNSAALTAPVVVASNKDYWLALAPDNATATFGRPSIQSALMFHDQRLMLKAANHPLPASATTFAITGSLPWIGIS